MTSARRLAVLSNLHWPLAPLSEIAEVKLGKMLDRAKDLSGRRLPYLRNINVRWGAIETDDLLEMFFDEGQLERFGLRPNDVLVCEGGEPGRAAVWDGRIEGLMFQKALHRVRFNIPYDPHLFVYYLETLARAGGLERRFTGSTIKHLTREALVQLPVPLLSPTAQRQVLDEIEKHLSRLEASVALLKRALANIKRVRRAVLNAACEGRLVPQVRMDARNPSGSTTETGPQLLERATAARQTRRTSGRSNPTPLSDTSSQAALPAGWAWGTLDQIADIKGGITKDQKRNSSPTARLVPYLRVANVQRGYLDLTEVKEIAAQEDEIRDLALRSGDILFNEGGDRDKLGRGWVWNNELPECIHQNHVFRARLLVPEIQGKFVSWYANTVGQKFFFDEGKHTTNLASISLSKLKTLPVPLPPPAEQQRIVSEVERRLTLVDQLERAALDNLQRAARLRQSILRKAFPDPQQ